MTTKRQLRDIIAFVRTLGVLDVRIKHGGKHPRLVGVTANGKRLRYILPSTPSDGRRGRRNVEADLRRACRG